jgi:hypothetical protein
MKIVEARALKHSGRERLDRACLNQSSLEFRGSFLKRDPTLADRVTI